MPKVENSHRHLDRGEAKTEADSWDHCVAGLLPPVLATDAADDRERRRGDALALAAAALRAAGESDLAAKLPK